MPATYKVYVDWANDGTFTAAADDVTARVLDGRAPVTVSYGRDTARAGAPVTGGEVGFTLDNESRDYSPENASSPLAGQVLPGRSVFAKATLSGVDYTVFRGSLDDFQLQPDADDHSITATCIDGLARLKGQQITTALYRGIRTGEAIGAILDAVGWTGTRDIDLGATVMPFWWLSNTDAFDAVIELIDSEGQPALATVGSDGGFVFRDRHHRVFRTESTTVQSTWRSSGLEPLVSSPTSYNHGWKEIINSVTYEVPLRQATGAASVAWSAPGRLSVAGGETLVVTATGGAAMMDAITPEGGVDYTLASGAVTVALSQTSGQTISILVTEAGAGAAEIDNLQLRARTIDTVATVRVTVEDAGSVAQYGRRSAKTERDPVWASPYDALAIGEILVGRRAQRLPTITVSMVGAGAAVRLLQILTRNLSDRVHLVEEHTGLDADCFVERISHSITQGGLEHRATFALERAPTEVATPLTFGVAGRGFNDGRFQAMGIVAGNAVLLFDAAGQGFNDGKFGY
jgi:hypothetical protein